MTNPKPAAFLFDLDGTVYTDGEAIPGARAAIEHLEGLGVPYCFVTNTTRKPGSAVLATLRDCGIPTTSDRIVTAVTAGVATLRQLGAGAVAPFVASDTLEDLTGFELIGGTSGQHGSAPDAVLMGDLGDDWSVELLNEAFGYVMNGACLVALQKNRYWQSGSGLKMDAGPFVAAVEYAAGVDAVLCGKPRGEFFLAAVEATGVRKEDRSRVVMVGDDIWGDIKGAQEAGLQGWLVRTGKFREAALADSGVSPDRVIDSIQVIAEL